MAVCELAGIENIGGKAIGSKNPLNLMRATFRVWPLCRLP